MINSKAALAELCKKLSKAKYLAVDTEFMREASYYPQLCLIQVAMDKEIFLIDPLAIDDLSDFVAILCNKKIIKIFHSAVQDFNVFYHYFKILPTPIFDTQIAASALGFGDQISYSKLVKKILNIDINKANKLSDWAKRPLTKNQQIYAESDVEHLAEIYLHLDNNLKKLKRRKWISDEINKLYEINRHVTDIEQAWQCLKLKNNNVYIIFQVLSNYPVFYAAGERRGEEIRTTSLTGKF